MASSIQNHVSSEVITHNRAISVESMASVKSLNDEGFTKKNETENAVMWRMVEHIKNKSSVREKHRQVVQAPHSNFGVSVHMEIIEEDVQEQFGTDCKKKGELSFFEKIRASKDAPDIAEFCTNNLFHGPDFQIKYYDPIVNADPPSMSEPASAILKDERQGVTSPGLALR
jgi:hypothetical protein